MNPLRQLEASGQAVWFDYIRRSLMTGGQLQRMVDQDGLRGVTANPAIFEKAITGSTDYTDALETLVRDHSLDGQAIYERLAIDDVQRAADIMASVYDATGGHDGYVSLEVSPALAHDSEGTCAEARRLWRTLARPNVMIKVPATSAGIAAIETLISEGINVNVTLIFSRSVYDRVAQAHIAGLETRVARGLPVSSVASVASFFISRIDVAVDAHVAERLAATRDETTRTTLQRLRGKVAVANAKLAYQQFQDMQQRPQWRTLAEKGARPQRLLWASTGTKSPEYRDTYYVEELIGQETVNTVPPATYDAFRDHGQVCQTLDQDVKAARKILSSLEEHDIAFERITDRLLDDGLQLFSTAFDKLLTAVVAPRKETCRPIVGRQATSLGPELQDDLATSTADWQAAENVSRLWQGDASLWTGADEGQWMGWLGITEDPATQTDHLRTIADDVRTGGFDQAVLLGMGGSSLCPEVFKMTFGRIDGSPELHVLDSTDPAQVQGVTDRVDSARTLFIVSSKSGTTLEPNMFKEYFFDRVMQRLGADQAGLHFIAITDPGSQLQHVAERDRFRHVVHGVPSIGGRYSALSNFGLVPAAVMGLDVQRLVDRADEMVQACAPCVPVRDNPGVVLGLTLGLAARRGRDKVTVVTSPGIWDMGAWLEQLLAESTGKNGKGLIPVDRERLGPPEVYGNDRMFVYLRLENAPEASQDEALARVETAGHPVVQIGLQDTYDIAQEFFRWEIATAVAGAVLGINPFDQPDVEASKVATRELTAAFETTGALPPETAIARDGDLAVYADDRNASAIGASESVETLVRAHLARLSHGDYFAVLGYVEMSERHDAQLQTLRHAVRDAKRVATCLGYGPRFLHSTGQAYKGGPHSGVFLQVTCEDTVDLAVPGHRYTFGTVKAAQARGDLAVLAERQRRALRVHITGDVERGLARVRELVERSVS